jgi:DNA replication protein DnaC
MTEWHAVRGNESDTEWNKCEAEYKERERQKAITRRRELAAIPARFRKCTFENYTPQNPKQEAALRFMQSYLAGFKEMLNAGACITLLGDYGTGKTHLACALLNALIVDTRWIPDTSVTLLYKQIPEVLQSIKDTYKVDSRVSETQVLRSLCNATLLVLDEVGEQRESDFERKYLSQIIDARYRELLPTIVISNKKAGEMANCIGERAVDRLFQPPSKAIPVTGSSYRRQPLQDASTNREAIQ